MNPRSVILFISLFSSFCLAANEDNAIVRKGDSIITHAKFDARIAQIPRWDRLAFVRDGGQVERLLSNLIRARQIADDARANDFDEDPVIRLQMEMAADQRLAKSWIAEQIEKSPSPDYDQLALEYFTANPDQFMSEASIDVSHILVSTEERGDEEALALANDIYGQLVADPGQFETLVAQYSDDESAAGNKGSFEGVKRGTMVPSFENAAFAMTEPGELSEPVKTNYGYHVIRMDANTPSAPQTFEQAKPMIVEQQKARHRDRVEYEFISQFASVPLEVPEGAVETMLKRYFGENLERAPDFSGN